MTNLVVKLICCIVVCFAAFAIHIYYTKLRKLLTLLRKRLKLRILSSENELMKDSARKKYILSSCMYYITFTIDLIFLVVALWIGLSIMEVAQ